MKREAVVVLLLSAAALSGAQVSGDEDATITDRKGKILSVFQIVSFPNAACIGGTKNGTCYTAEECSGRGGVNDGSCASGYGVCCTFTLTCGGTSSENCTYFDSSAPQAGGCSVTICPCNNNICQLRLDFSTFVITGPQTSSASSVKTKNGVVSTSNAALSQSLASQCLTDTFSVTGNGITPPVICGTNSGEHMYVDASQACNTLAFQLGTGGATNQPAVATRSWSIKVNQYSCDYTNLAPSGCTQYFFGATTGTFQSYNYNAGNGYNLANQQQQTCFRRENGLCRICYYTTTPTDFDVSGATGTVGLLSTSACCGYGANAEGTKGFDCIQIPGASQAASGKQTPSNLCGGSGLATSTSAAGGIQQMMSVCSTLTPFIVNFRTDAYEGAMAAIGEAGSNDAGYLLSYTMDAINC